MVNVLVWSIGLMLAAASTTSAYSYPYPAFRRPSYSRSILPQSFYNAFRQPFFTQPMLNEPFFGEGPNLSDLPDIYEDGFPFPAFGRPSLNGPNLPQYPAFRRPSYPRSILPQSFYNAFQQPFFTQPMFNESFLGDGLNLADLPDQYNNTTEKYEVIDGVTYVTRTTIIKDHGTSSVQIRSFPLPPRQEYPSSSTTSSVGIAVDTNPEEDVQPPFGIRSENPANPEAN